ncbi:hypothetical protein E4U56_000114 [Claviceps arundinis]|uniref:Uncharacterized protein n=1 Tax=Claviceps arundinis TaxID=1623583 RepID=A0A9P7N1A7_9HYPO|nr:hypothetical protein E4U56_000114 [Claviceps arundinis]
MRSRGMPCWHRLAELWRTSGVLQASDFHEHWWIEYGQAPQAPQAPQAAQAAQPNIPPLEPQAIEIPQRQQRSPPRSDDRDPNLSERLDSAPSLSGGLNSNNRVATTAPQPTLDSLKIVPAVPQDRLFVYQATLPAVATPTTATTALSRPISAQNQQPPRASQTPLPAAALQQLPSHMLQRQQQQQQQFAHGQPPQHQLQAYPPPQSLRQVPLQSPRSPHQPQPPPSSSHRQAPALRWIVTTPNHAQPQQRPQRSRPPGAPISGAKNAR